LSDIDCNKNCCEVNTKHSKAPKQAVAKDQRKRQRKRQGSTKSSINGDEATVLKEDYYKGNFAKARSNKKRRGKRVDHILNSM